MARWKGITLLKQIVHPFLTFCNLGDFFTQNTEKVGCYNFGSKNHRKYIFLFFLTMIRIMDLYLSFEPLTIRFLSVCAKVQLFLVRASFKGILNGEITPFSPSKSVLLPPYFKMVAIMHYILKCSGQWLK